MKVRPVDGSEIENDLSIVRFCEKVNANLFYLTSKLSKERNLYSNIMNEIVLDIILHL